MMRRFALLLVLVVLAGCGGGGGGNTVAPPINSTIRQIHAGDQVVYAFTGAYTPLGSAPLPMTGTLTVTIYNDTVSPTYGTRALKGIMEGTFWANESSMSLVTTGYIEQGADGSLYDTGSSDARLVSSVGTPYDCKSPLASGAQWSYTAHYSDGLTLAWDYTVIGTEVVGGQTAYRVHWTSVKNGATCSGDNWMVPDWGRNIRETVTMSNSDGSIAGTITLTSKNF